MTSLTAPVSSLFQARFLLVSYLPTLAGLLFVGVLILAGAPGADLSLPRAWTRIEALTGAAVAALFLVTVLTAVLLAPFQLLMVRALEGGLPPRVASMGVRVQTRRWQRFHRRLQQVQAVPDPSTAQVQRAGALDHALHLRFPADSSIVRPTALGNVLLAAELRAGAAYGLDAVVVWPRLYPLLDPATRAVVDDRRNLMDGSARTCVTFAGVTVASAVLLWQSGPWIAVTIVPLALILASYAATVQAAISYGQSVEVAVELHRFDLYAALHLPVPANTADEVVQNERLCLHWRQGVPLKLNYSHATDSTDSG